MATDSASLLPLLLLFARLSALTVALLVLIWALGFKTSSLPHSPSSELLIYDVNPHTLFVYAQHIFASAPSIANGDWVHSHQWRSDFGARWLPGSRNLKKSVHLCLQGVALACGIFGIWTKFHGQDGIVANFFSLHSWMGLICVFLFGAQRGSKLTVKGLRQYSSAAAAEVKLPCLPTRHITGSQSQAGRAVSDVLSLLFLGAVADGFLELLAQRGEANDKGASLALAHLPGSIYLWLSRGDS
ncbi:hypothetical protein C3L33_17037, partial [Rhododendron williamsianum]